MGNAVPDADLSEFEELTAKHGPECSVRIALNALEESDRRNVTAALATDHVSGAAIVRWFNRRGVKIGSGTVQRHRHGECRCD